MNGLLLKPDGCALSLFVFAILIIVHLLPPIWEKNFTLAQFVFLFLFQPQGSWRFPVLMHGPNSNFILKKWFFFLTIILILCTYTTLWLFKALFPPCFHILLFIYVVYYSYVQLCSNWDYIPLFSSTKKKPQKNLIAVQLRVSEMQFSQM